MIRLPGAHTMYGSFVVQARRIVIAIAFEVGHKTSLIVHGMFEGARTQRYVGGKIAQEPIGAQPIVAQCTRPLATVNAFPLWSEVPAEWYGFRPERSAK